jgi:hypothetical protein
VLGFFWLWLLAAIEPEESPRPYIPSNIYREGKAKIGRLVSANELLSADDLPRLAQYYRKCWRQVAQTIGRDKRPIAIEARDKAIVSHWREAVKKCRIVPKAYRSDAIQACLERPHWDVESLGA